MIILTERLIIRNLCEADYPEFERILNDVQKLCLKELFSHTKLVLPYSTTTKTPVSEHWGLNTGNVGRGEKSMTDYESVESRLSLARELAAESIVLLKNEDGCLPLAKDMKIVLLGRTQNAAVIGGGGSGASFSENTLQAVDELAAAGLLLEPGMEAFYKEIAEQEKAAATVGQPDFADMDLAGLVNSGLIYEIFGKYTRPADEPMPEAALWKQASAWADTAVCIIGRVAGGEECDRRVKDDYYLLDSESELIKKAAGRIKSC